MNQVAASLTASASPLARLDYEQLAKLPVKPDTMDLSVTSTSSGIPAAVLVPLVSIFAYFAFLQILRQLRVCLRAMNLALQLLCIQRRSSGETRLHSSIQVFPEYLIDLLST